MVYKCSKLSFYTYFLVILLSNVDCLHKTRGKRSHQSSWLNDQQEYIRDGRTESTNKEQNNNKNVNSFEIIVLEGPRDNQSPSNRYESAEPKPITLTADNIELLSLIYDGKQQPQTRLQANVSEQNFKPLPLKIEPKYFRGQPDAIKWELPQSVQNGGPQNTERNLPPSDSWRSPQPPGGGRPPRPESDYSPFDVMKPPHPPPPDSGRPPLPSGSGPPSHLPPSDVIHRETRDPPPHARGRGPPPHARGRGPPHKEFGPPRRNWESDPEDERNFYIEQSDSKIKTPTQWGKSSDNSNRQDSVYNNHDPVYNRNQGSGIPLTNNQRKPENIQQYKPQQHLFQVVPVTPEN